MKYNLRNRWSSMLSRCYDSDNPGYHRYGGRGIYVCDEWHNFDNYYEWCINNGYQQELQLDRIDNDGPYHPDNCRFVTQTENARNKSNNIRLKAWGETKAITAWHEDSRCKVDKVDTLRSRYHRGWKHEDILVIPEKLNAGNMITAFGETKSILAWERDERCSVSDNTIIDRINNGIIPEDAISTPQTNAGLVRAWGEEKTIEEWVNDSRCNVGHYNSLAYRLKIGMRPEDAISQEKTPVGAAMNDPKYKAFGENKTLAQWSIDPRCKVEKRVLWDRLTRGWDVEEAITKSSAANRGIRIDGKSILEWSKLPECEVGYNTLSKRIKQGIHPADAMTKRLVAFKDS